MEKKKKKTSIVIVILNYFCAVGWSISLILNIVRWQDDTLSFILRLVNALGWTVCAVIWTIRYRKEKKESDQVS